MVPAATDSDLAQAARISKPHILTLDSLRGIAAVCVIFVHMPWMPFRETSFTRNCYLMVDFFFILSGFVIAHSYEDRIRDAAQLGKFMWLRFWRLYPVHFLMLMAFAALEVAAWFGHGKLGVGVSARHFATNGPFAFANNLFLMQSLHLNPALTFNGPSWSISVEFWTYLLFAVLMLVLARLKLPRWPVLLLTSAAALVALNWITDLPLTKTWDWGILRGIAGFFLGALLHHIYVSAQPYVRGHNRTEQAFDALSIVAFLGAVAFLIWERDFGRSTMLILPLASGLVLGSALAPDGWMAKFLLLRPLRWLGAISYSIYMVHLFVIRMVLAALKIVFHMPTVDVDVSGQAVPTINSTIGVGILAALVSVGVTLFVAHFMYRWVEVTWRSWSKAVLQRRSQAGTAGALGPLP